MLGLGGYGDLLASIRLADRPEVLLGRALARGQSLDEGCVEARLRVEAISLIPRVVQFAKEARLRAPTFDALLTILSGGSPSGPASLVEKMFAG
jgi:glycerol-3-phosphate dehydrogenase (NAD(P)+)